MNVDPPVCLEKKNEENTGDYLPGRTEPNSVDLSSLHFHPLLSVRCVTRNVHTPPPTLHFHATQG